MTEPTDAEIWQLWMPMARKGVADPVEFARAVLAMWGTPAGVGEVVAIREALSHFRLTHWADEDGGLGLADALAQLYGDDDIGRADEELDALADEISCIFTTPQPTQAQAGAVPTRAFLERTLAAMEGVIDVADRKTDEFDALRSCVIDLTLMLFSDAKRHTKGACHER